MGLLDTLSAGFSRRSATSSGVASPERWLLDLLGGGEESYSGKTVSIESSMTLVPVFSAVTLLAGAVGSLPLHTYRRLDPNGRERATDHRMASILHTKPNELMAADELWEIVGAHLNLWGNAFLAKGRGKDGLVNELVPLSPNLVSVGTDARNLPLYLWTDPLTGKEFRAGMDTVLHIRGLSYDGKIGLSPIQAARQMLGTEMAREHFQGAFWRNNARPGGILKHPNELSQKAERRLRGSWESVQGGLANAGKTAILEEGMEWQQLGLPLADAQFIEQAKFSRTDYALLFRIPPYMLAADSGGTSLQYSTVEGHSLDFVKWSLRRWLRRIEGSVNRDADIFPQGQRLYAEFLIDALLRADSATRGQFYQRALDPTKGWLDVDEVREMENLNPLTPAQKRARAAAAKAAKPEPAKPDGGQPADDSQDDGGNNDGGDDPQEGVDA